MSIEPSRILAQKASLSPRAIDGLVDVQTTTRRKRLHTCSDLKTAVLNSAGSP